MLFEQALEKVSRFFDCTRNEGIRSCRVLASLICFCENYPDEFLDELKASSDDVFLLRNSVDFLFSHACDEATTECVAYIIDKMFEKNKHDGIFSITENKAVCCNRQDVFDLFVRKIDSRWRRKKFVEKVIRKCVEKKSSALLDHVLMRCEFELSNDDFESVLPLVGSRCMVHILATKPEFDHREFIENNRSWLERDLDCLERILAVFPPCRDIFPYTNTGLIGEYKKDPIATAKKLREELRISSDAAQFFAFVIFACDGLLEISN